ncbi:5'-nucleotidase C-terminal domain-containing protein [Schnuerera sp. xch1]|uniref:5'-nucleotidase C-terminal domain-containing protein n=1 Tax=Schnuerera sp. xch1 TaxID=2874283 RepID=UPI001CBCFB3C|nr:5'-nucleotidase C-terminal domain-containing protein [Schnuerera sp. xch1]MBZ2175889.1 5'-nucleotidase C-terminal domain-containing protein [Schnuerera sp. xch1]
MHLKRKKLLSFVLSFILIIRIVTIPVNAEKKSVQLIILGTTDIHGNIYNWSYEDGEEVDNIGFAKVYSVVEAVRDENPNTLLVDNGDVIQGTILTDDLYNIQLDKSHPVIDVMNFMGYDSMTLGNHEFNFGTGLINKMVDEAEFPILSANIYNKGDGSNFVKPYIVKEVAGIKVGILGLTTPNIPRWDGPRVTELEFEPMDVAAEKYVEELKEVEDVDIIIATSHAGLDGEYDAEGGDSAKKVIENNPEIEAILVGHDHASVAEMVGDTAVGGATDTGTEVVRFDLFLENNGEQWEVTDKKVELINVAEYEASEELKEYAKEYHDATLEFLEVVIGQASDDFHPAPKIEGISEGLIRDTAVMDLINQVQLENTGADISAAALFSPTSNIEKGGISYSDIFDIYKYPNTLVAVEISGAELKNYMEWSAAFYNTYKAGDVTIGFNPEIRPYNYDMFQGVEYKIDISKPTGERIVDLTFDGEPVKDDDTFNLTINNYRLSGLQSMGIVSNEPYYTSDPVSLRTLIADHIGEQGTIEPKVDNNWEIIGADLEHPLRDYIVEQINEGNIELPSSEDGRSINIKAINVNELIEEGIISEEVLEKHGTSTEVEDTPSEPEVEELINRQEKVYVVNSGDVLWKIAKKFNTTWERLAEFNDLSNPHLIFPDQEILIPAQ